MNALHKMNYWFYQFSKKLGTALLVVLVASITMGIVARYVFKSPFVWTEELSTFLFIWLSFMGATAASYDNRHVAVDYLFNKMPKGPQHVVKLITFILIMLFMVLLVVSAFILMPHVPYKSVALKIPRAFYYVAICLASAEMFFIYLEQMIVYCKEAFGKKKEAF